MIAALNSDDPGTQNLATSLMALPNVAVQAALGNEFDEKAVSDLKRMTPAVGSGAIVGSADCMARCGLTAASLLS